MDPLELSIDELAAAYRRREISPVEVAELAFARAERLQPHLHALLEVTRERGMAEARRAEEMLRGDEAPALAGAPVVHKDNLDTAGVATTAGCPWFVNRVPEADAAVVRRLAEAGAVTIGKANMYELAIGGEAAVTNSPWAESLSPSGSSSGSAVAVAASLCLGATGTDSAGSVRSPAAACGVVGFKPSRGVLDTAGMMPLAPSFDSIGPLAHSVADVKHLFEAMAERRLATGGEDHAATIGISEHFFQDDLDTELGDAFDDARRVFEELGLSVVQVPLPSAREASQTGRILLLSEASRYWGEHAAGPKDELTWVTRAAMSFGHACTESTIAYARACRDRFASELEEVFQRIDLLLVPASRGVPPLHGQDRKGGFASASPTMAFSLWDMPAIALPAGFTEEGLPLGIQLGGLHGRDDVVLSVAARFQAATDWHRRRPSLDWLPGTTR